YGDGSNLDNVPGDNLGNHVATTKLDMANFDIVSVSTITVSSITTAGAGIVFSTHTYFMNGNVGIGTENPSNKFHIEGSAGGSAGIYLNSAAPSSTSNTLYNSGGTLYWNGAMVGAQTPWTSSINAAGYTLYGNDTANGNLTLDSTSDGTKGYLILNPTSGNVGIANTNPSYTLEVKGTFHAGPPTSSFSATGGTITTSGGYTIHTFTGNGTFTPNGSRNVEVLVVAGGGGGGSGHYAGGAGAGGLIYNSSYFVTAQAYTITVGNGGTGSTSVSLRGSNGENSVFGAFTAIGGGGGGSRTAQRDGSSGGSGGGASWPSVAGGGGTAGQGNAGGTNSATGYGGAGGGAGEAGLSGTTNPYGQDGADGLEYSISGAATYYAGGGAGGSGAGGNRLGGLGGGGRSAESGIIAAENGTANTGGGGGGGASTDSGGSGVYERGGNGGSGIIIIRYLTASVTGDGIFIDSSNNIGIGEPAPTEKLDVQGGNIRNSALASGIGNRCVYADSNGVLHIKSDDCGLAGASGDNLGSHTMTQNLRSSGYWISNSGASEGIFPLAGGNIGIGTSSPGARLDVQETNTSNSYSLRVGTSATAYHMAISTMGNVGIGTENPSNKFHIEGSAGGSAGIYLNSAA
ncbi:MAG: hypothetical protein KAI33_06315, partial [Elusimicrobiales bacterium]|nr:hypothetical protein [Elusimicrobiales bacterium]